MIRLSHTKYVYMFFSEIKKKKTNARENLVPFKKKVFSERSPVRAYVYIRECINIHNNGMLIHVYLQDLHQREKTQNQTLRMQHLRFET